MSEQKPTFDELIKREVKSSVQTQITAELITNVAARAARDIRVNTELDTLLKGKPSLIMQFKPVFWAYIAVVLFVGFLFAIPVLTLDSESVSDVPEVLLELELAANGVQMQQTLILLIAAIVVFLLVFCFIFIPMWNNLKRLGKI